MAKFIITAVRLDTDLKVDLMMDRLSVVFLLLVSALPALCQFAESGSTNILVVSAAPDRMSTTQKTASQEAEPRNPGETLGGTIDIVMANGNGLVAVTDSRLSNQGRPVTDHGEKLFQMDDHTLCVIAGWYSDPGPSVDNKTFPAYAAVSGIVRSFAKNESSASKSDPAESRVAALARYVAFTLNAVQQILERRGNRNPPEASEITLATATKDHIEVARMDLTPVRQGNGGFGFVPTLRGKFEVRDVLQYEIAGVEEVGRPLLDVTRTEVNDPTIVQYRDAVKKNGGRDLSLEDLIQTARRVEILTSRQVGNVVGGPIEIGTIQHGVAKITQDNPLVTEEDRRASARFSIMDQMTVGGDAMRWELGSDVMLFTDSQLTGARFKLDGMLAYHNVFKKCRLVYDGSPAAVFDKSNEVVRDSVLVLTRREYSQSPVVIQFQKDFPGVVVGVSRHPETE